MQVSIRIENQVLPRFSSRHLISKGFGLQKYQGTVQHIPQFQRSKIVHYRYSSFWSLELILQKKDECLIQEICQMFYGCLAWLRLQNMNKDSNILHKQISLDLFPLLGSVHILVLLGPNGVVHPGISIDSFSTPS